jgi:protein TonB
MDLDTPPPAIDMPLKAEPGDRLVPPGPPSRKAAARFALVLAFCLLAHLAIIAMFLTRDEPEPTILAEQEIPVELVAEMPPEKKPEPPPQKKKEKAPPPVKELVEPPPVKPKPPPPKVELEDVEVAHDAPKAGDSDNTKRGEPDKPSAAPKIAPSAKQDPQKPPEKNTPDDPPPAEKDAEAAPAPDATPEKPVEEKPDAEPLDKAKPPPPKPKEKKAPAAAKTPPGTGRAKSVADQLAALSPAPSYSLGASAKSAPISGGTEKASYESLLYGLIRRRYQPPPTPAGHAIVTPGMIGIYIDEMGNLTHQVVYRTSGRPGVDNAWMVAIRRAAPFPAPPRGVPHALTLTYPSDGS